MASLMLENIESIKVKTRTMFLENDNSHPPLFMLNTDKGIGLMPCFWKDSSDKKRTSDLIKQLIAEGSLQELIFVAEAWVSECASIKEFREGKRKRKEVLMVQYQSPNENLLFSADILRDGEDVTLGEWVRIDEGSEPKSGVAIGLFDSLFARGKATSN